MLKIILIVLGCLVGSSLGRWLAGKTAKKLLSSSAHTTSNAPNKTEVKATRKCSKNQLKRLDHDFEPIFSTRYTPSYKYGSVDDNENRSFYSGILKDAVKHFERQYNSPCWLLESFSALHKQNQLMPNLRDEIKDLLPQLEVGNLDQLIDLVADIFDAYEKNQTDAIRYLTRFYAFETRYKKSDEQKSALLDLVKDNDRIIAGLEEFCTSIRTYLANLYQDEVPAHLTNFSSLELLHKASERINAAVSGAEASQAQVAKENEMEERLKRVPKITLLGDDVPLMESKPCHDMSSEEFTNRLLAIIDEELSV